jgi:hypothetical protein
METLLPHIAWIRQYTDLIERTASQPSKQTCIKLAHTVGPGLAASLSPRIRISWSSNEGDSIGQA